MATKELSKTKQSGEVVDYKVLSIDPARLQDVIQTNLGGKGVSPFDMDRVKVPSGGASVWQLPTLQGLKNSETFQGIILHYREMRSYWPGDFGGGNTPPHCSSDDGLVGVGDPGGSCKACPFALFGSAAKGHGQACKQVQMIFILRPDDLMPLVLPLPPTSHKNFKTYLYRLSSRIVRFQEAVTEFSLGPASNADGIHYSKADFKMVRLLTDEERATIQSVARAMNAACTAQTIHATDVQDGTNGQGE